MVVLAPRRCLFVVGLVGLAYYVWSAVSEERFHHSAALDMVFEGEGTNCIGHFEWWGPHPLGTTVLPDGTHYSTQPATIVRLHVKTLRARRLGKVQVRLIEAQSLDGTPANLYSDWLKWMHDDSPSHPASVEGRQVDPGDELAYIDLATKVNREAAYVLDYAMPHLRAAGQLSRSTYVHLVATGADTATDRAAPDCHRAFVIAVTEDGGLTVRPAELRKVAPNQQAVGLAYDHISQAPSSLIPPPASRR